MPDQNYTSFIFFFWFGISFAFLLICKIVFGKRRTTMIAKLFNILEKSPSQTVCHYFDITTLTGKTLL